VPSRVDEQLEWLAVGLRPAVVWSFRDLAVLIAHR